MRSTAIIFVLIFPLFISADTIVLHNGDRIEDIIVREKIGNQFKFSYEGEQYIKPISAYAVKELIFSSGRTETFEPLTMFQVVVTQNKDDVVGLIEVGSFTTSTTSGWITLVGFTIGGTSSASEKMRKHARIAGGGVVLIQQGFGDVVRATVYSHQMGMFACENLAHEWAEDNKTELHAKIQASSEPGGLYLVFTSKHPEIKKAKRMRFHFPLHERKILAIEYSKDGEEWHSLEMVETAD